MTKLYKAGFYKTAHCHSLIFRSKWTPISLLLCSASYLQANRSFQSIFAWYLEAPYFHISTWHFRPANIFQYLIRRLKNHSENKKFSNLYCLFVDIWPVKREILCLEPNNKWQNCTIVQLVLQNCSLPPIDI